MSAEFPAIRIVPRILGILQCLWIGRGVGLPPTAGITRLVFMIHRATRAIDGTSTSRCGVVLEHRTLPT